MIFLDTGFVFALFVEGDEYHARVREVFEGYRGRRLEDVFLTTNHVISETITLLRKRGHPDSRVRHRLRLHPPLHRAAGAAEVGAAGHIFTRST